MIEQRACQSCEERFPIEPDDLNFYAKIGVPPPTWCPRCRMLRRFVWRNEQRLFRRKDDRTGLDIFSSFPAAAQAKVWDLAFWDSDGWDPGDYGRDYDFNRPFFEQFRDFLYSVPWPSKSVLRMVDSEYCDQSEDMKNCYLCFTSMRLEDSAYVVQGRMVKDSLDLYQAHHTDLSYDSYMVDECSRVFFSVNCEESTDIWFSKDLLGCGNCFGCVGLRNKNYYIFNEPYSKEEYHKYIDRLDLGSDAVVSEFKQKSREFWLKFPVRYALVIKCANSTGEHIEHSKDLKWCYSVHEGVDLGHCQFMVPPVTDSLDYTNGWDSSRMYESLTCGEECAGLRFCWECWPGCRDLEYSAFCRSSEDLFGCVGLKKKQYCVFNKQYSKEEYFELRERIIASMGKMPYRDSRGRRYGYGEFFPPEFSPFAYNETLAWDFFPVSRKNISDFGSFWRKPESRAYETTIAAKDLPDNIQAAEEGILKEIIKCGDCGGAYRLIQLELQFYRRMGLPLPRLCADCRFKDRFKLVNPPRFWPGVCQCAGKSSKNGIYKNVNPEHLAHNADEACANLFQTSFAPGRVEILYCEQCYNDEVS